MNRRGFLQAILAAGVAPAVVGSGILMPVRTIILPWDGMPWLDDSMQWKHEAMNALLDNHYLRPAMIALTQQIDADLLETLRLGRFPSAGS